MPRVLLVSGSPTRDSRSASLLSLCAGWLGARGVECETLILRDLPAEPLLLGQLEAPPLAQTLTRLASVDGVVIATPIYKAAYAGLLKVWLDLLPQFGLAGKAVLPLATGGSLAHVLAIDYALRPVLSSLGARHIAPGWFVLDSLFTRDSGGQAQLDASTEMRLRALVDDFAAMLVGGPE